jgi:hypothetical protein
MFFNAKANIRISPKMHELRFERNHQFIQFIQGLPYKLDKPLTGILKVDVTTKFDGISRKANMRILKCGYNESPILNTLTKTAKQ